MFHKDLAIFKMITPTGKGRVYNINFEGEKVQMFGTSDNLYNKDYIFQTDIGKNLADSLSEYNKNILEKSIKKEIAEKEAIGDETPLLIKTDEEIESELSDIVNSDLGDGYVYKDFCIFDSDYLSIEDSNFGIHLNKIKKIESLLKDEEHIYYILGDKCIILINETVGGSIVDKLYAIINLVELPKQSKLF